MASLRDLRRRIKSVASTEKITKAMELVAAAKVRRAQEHVLRSRPFTEHIEQVVADVSDRSTGLHHRYLEPATGNRRLMIVITTDRGLCGALNSNTLRLVLKRMQADTSQPWPLAVIGRKGRDMMKRLERTLIAEVTNIGDLPGMSAVLPVVHAALDEFDKGNIDCIDVAYAHFVSLGRQVATIKQVLPVVIPPDTKAPQGDFDYEPDVKDILDNLLPRYVEAIVYQAVLENAASEQAAKMLAMRNASENAKDLIQSLTLTSNKVRQSAITTELMDIVGGASALEG